MAEHQVRYPYGMPPYPLLADEWEAFMREEAAEMRVRTGIREASENPIPESPSSDHKRRFFDLR